MALRRFSAGREKQKDLTEEQTQEIPLGSVEIDSKGLTVGMRELGFVFKEKEIHNIIRYLDDDGHGNIRCTQQKLNVEKNKAWGTTATAQQSARNFVLNGEHLDVVSKLKSLGIQFRCAEGMSNDVAEDPVSKGIAGSRRTRWAPLKTKASLIACLVGLAAIYGFPAGGYTFRLINALRTVVVAALRGARNTGAGAVKLC